MPPSFEPDQSKVNKLEQTTGVSAYDDHGVVFGIVTDSSGQSCTDITYKSCFYSLNRSARPLTFGDRETSLRLLRPSFGPVLPTFASVVSRAIQQTPLVRRCD